MVEDVLQICGCIIVLTLQNQLLLLIRRYTYNWIDATSGLP